MLWSRSVERVEILRSGARTGAGAGAEATYFKTLELEPELELHSFKKLKLKAIF